MFFSEMVKQREFCLYRESRDGVYFKKMVPLTQILFSREPARAAMILCRLPNIPSGKKKILPLLKQPPNPSSVPRERLLSRCGSSPSLQAKMVLHKQERNKKKDKRTKIQSGKKERTPRRDDCRSRWLFSSIIHILANFWFTIRMCFVFLD